MCEILCVYVFDWVYDLSRRLTPGREWSGGGYEGSVKLTLGGYVFDWVYALSRRLPPGLEWDGGWHWSAVQITLGG